MTDRKTFTPHELKLEDSGSIELAFAQLNVIDSDNDVTLPGAFPTKNVPMSAYGHTSWDGALPVGKGSIAESGDWAVFKGQFFMSTTHGRDAYETVKAMADLQEYSYGYTPTDFSFGQKDGQAVRYLKALDVFEVSPVLKGAGLGTHTLAIKSGAPGPDAPYAEQLSWYAEGLPALLDRVKARADFRATQNRKLSRSDRAQLEDLATAFEGHLAAVQSLLVVPEDPAAIQQRQQEILVLVGEAETLGVPV